MANGNALIAALRSATPQGRTTAPGASTSFEAPWTNVSRKSLSDVLSMEAPFMPLESWRDTANIGPPYSGYKDPNYSPPEDNSSDPTVEPTVETTVVVAPPPPTPPFTNIGEFEPVAPNFWDDLNAEYAAEWASWDGSDEDWVNSNKFRNYQARVLGGIENTFDTDKLQGDIASFDTQLDDPIFGANAKILRDAEQAQLEKIKALAAFEAGGFNFFNM